MRGSFSFSPRPRLGRAFVRACRVLCVRVCECDWHAYASDCAERRADLTTCEFFLYSPLSGSGVILFLYYFFGGHWDRVVGFLLFGWDRRVCMEESQREGR